MEYLTDPVEIFRKYKNQVDIVIDGGPGKNSPSTVVDCTDESFTVLREGIADIDEFL